MAQATIERALGAVARRDWRAAYEGFASAPADAFSAPDLEAYADAAWWLSRFDDSIDARQRAYAAYAAAGDDVGAAATASRLAIEHFVRERPSIGTGFLLRAQRHAKHVPDGPGHGYLAMVESSVARFGGDLERAVQLGRYAVELAEGWGDPDLMAMALHVLGLALVDAGEIIEGLGCMDEAMVSVLAGGLDPYFTGIIFCGLIAACLELQDVRRAGEWSDAARTWCATLRPDAPFPGMCAVNHAEVARLRGDWGDAESELVHAAETLFAIEPAMAAPAFVQLGEVRRRAGDVDGAEQAFLRAAELGADPQPGLALLRAATGRAAEAATDLRHAVDVERQPARRAALLAAFADAAVASGALADARGAAESLRSLADDAGTAPLDALARAAAGRVALASEDAARAAAELAQAATAFDELALPYEAARARVGLARALLALDDRSAAQPELDRATTAFERLGAKPDLDEISRLRGGSDIALPAGLTPREAEVLNLVAAGKSNRDIAVELVISEHTVSRHLQNIFAKIGVSSRAAATAFAFEHSLA
jgi:ATP/maltotriose-dependent transcriptional regulator MalT